MINLKQNLDSVEKMVLSFLMSSEHTYVLVNDNNMEISRMKLMNAIHPNFFDNLTYKEIAIILKDFVYKYGKLPNSHEVWHIIETNNMDISSGAFNIIADYDLSQYTKAFVYEYINAFVMFGNLNSTISGMLSHLKSQKIDPKNINEVLEYVRNEIGAKLSIDLTDNTMGLDLFDLDSHIQIKKNTTKTGFDFLDRVLGGGWEPKTLVVFMGRPKIGKSLVLSNLAARALGYKLNVGVLTVELSDKKYMKRIGSNLLSIPFKNYETFDKSDLKTMEELARKLKSVKEKIGKLHIKEFPTGTVSPIDIENYFLKMQELHNIKYDLILIDYLNLLKVGSDKTMYEKIKTICEQLRAVAQRNNWCIVSATQVKTQYFNTELFLDSAAESSALQATVDSLFGLYAGDDQNVLIMKNLANRDEGYMDSWKAFIKVKEYFRLKELVHDEKIKQYAEHYTDTSVSTNDIENQDYMTKYEGAKFVFESKDQIANGKLVPQSAEELIQEDLKQSESSVFTEYTTQEEIVEEEYGTIENIGTDPLKTMTSQEMETSFENDVSTTLIENKQLNNKKMPPDFDEHSHHSKAVLINNENISNKMDSNDLTDFLSDAEDIKENDAVNDAVNDTVNHPESIAHERQIEEDARLEIDRVTLYKDTDKADKLNVDVTHDDILKTIDLE